MAKTVVGAFYERAAAAPDEVAVIEKRFGKWVERPCGDVSAEAALLANGLGELQVGPGDTVALMVSARLEWITYDLAIQAIGARSLAIPTRFREEDVVRILAESGAATAIAERQDEADVVLTAMEAGELPALRRIVYIDPAGVADYASDVLVSADELRTDGADLGALAEALDPTATAALIPTIDASSLTPISHATMLQATRSTIEAFELGKNDRMIAVRDMADPAERGATLYAALLSGAMLAVPESVNTTDAAIHEIAPTYVHVTERWLTHQAAQITVRFDENHGIKSRLAASWKKRTGSSLERYGSGRAPRGLWRFMVSIPILEELGLEKARAVVVSGDPSPSALVGFYTALGLPVRPALAVRKLAGFATIGYPTDADGWVGTPAPGVEVTIEAGKLVASTEAAGRIVTQHSATELDGGFVVNGSSPEEAAETQLRAVPAFATAIVSPGAKSVTVELDPAIASRWAARNELEAATYRSFSQLPEMQAGVRAAVRRTLKQFDLDPENVAVFPTPLHDIPGALSFGDVARRDLIELPPS